MRSFLHREKGFYRNVVKLALPILLQNLITNSLGLVDTFMVGLLGEVPLAAVTLANIPCFVIILMTFGFQSGSSVLISQHWGKGDTDTINRVMGIGMYVAGAITLVFALIMFFLPLPFMSLFGNDAEVVALAAQYARIVGFSYFADSFVQLYIAAHRSMENPRLGLYILALTMFTNTLLNWIFIFGNLGAPALGVEGAALATLLARCIGLVITGVYALVNKRFRLKPALILRPGTALLSLFARYSTPVVLNETLWGLGTALYATVLGHMDGSKEILAAYAISGNIERICTVAVFALAATAAIIVGREIGAGRRDTVYEIGGCLNLLAFLSGLVMTVVLLILLHTCIVPYLYPIFDLSERAASVSTTMLTIVFSILALRSFDATNIVGVLRGGGDVRTATLIDLLPLWLVALPLTALTGLVLRLDILWVYLAMVSENIVKCFLGVRRFRSGEWIHDLTVTHYQKEGETDG